MPADEVSVQVDNLTFGYPGHAYVLHEINLRVLKGEMFGIIGPNGAGKSTLCKAFNGLVPQFYGGTYGGEVTVSGMNVMKHTVAELSLKVGLVFQEPSNQFSGVSTRVDEEVAFGMSMMGFQREEMADRISDSLRKVGLEGLEDRSPFELSGGQQQRLAIATVLAVKPEVIVMDEPTAQLDPVGKTEVLETMRALNREGYTIIVAEHEIEELASFADRIIALNEGRIVLEGSTRNVLTQIEQLKKIGVDPPSITELSHLMAAKAGFTPEDYPITLDEAITLYRDRIRGDS
ncbi:MAG: ATP-binding cassette domain-containing protein [Candidatus Bathyarchaeia archaeon]|jgi:energy-coupling factor transporter ATP-binding protein EcfA2